MSEAFDRHYLRLFFPHLEADESVLRSSVRRAADREEARWTEQAHRLEARAERLQHEDGALARAEERREGRVDRLHGRGGERRVVDGEGDLEAERELLRVEQGLSGRG